MAANEPSAPPTSGDLASQLAQSLLTQKLQTSKFLLTTILVGILVGLIALSLAWRQGLFERNLLYKFATPSGQNLSRGMAVQFKGFKNGYLDALDLQTDGRITGEVVIKQKHAAFVTQGAVLRISKDKIVTSELVLEPGPAGGTPMPSGSELALKTDGGIDALEKRILERVDPVLAELTALMKRLGDPQHGVPSAVEALRVSLVQANTTLMQVNTTLGTANRTFSDLDARIKDPKIDGILANAEQTLAGLKTNTDQLNKTMESTQQLMGTGQQLMQTGQGSLQSTNRELAATLQATQRVLQETTALLEDMRGSTLGRWIVGPRKAASASAPAPASAPAAP